MNTLKSRFTKFFLMATILFGGLVAVPEPALATGGGADIGLFGGVVGGGQAEQKFGALQTRLKSFAVVVLLIMLVIAGIMAAMQKVQMAINIAIAAIILFGGAYILLMLAEGLGAA